MCVNNLPKVVTWQCPDSESILGPVSHQSGSLLLHHKAIHMSIGGDVIPYSNNHPTQRLWCLDLGIYDDSTFAPPIMTMCRHWYAASQSS